MRSNVKVSKLDSVDKSIAIIPFFYFWCRNVCEVLCEELDTLEQPTSVRVVSEALESDQSNRIESDSNQFRQSEQFVPDESYASDNQS